MLDGFCCVGLVVSVTRRQTASRVPRGVALDGITQLSGVSLEGRDEGRKSVLVLLDGLDGDGASVLEGRNDTSLDSLGGVVGSIPHPGVVPDLLDGGTHLGLLGHHHAGEISELRRDVLIKLRSLLGEHAEESTLVLTVEGVATIQHGVDDDAETVDVSLRTSVGLAADQLGGGITDTAGKVSEDVIRSRDHLGGESKVDQEDAEGIVEALSTLDEDVLELDVTVAVALLVSNIKKIHVDRVLSQLESEPQLQLVYLDNLFIKTMVC